MAEHEQQQQFQSITVEEGAPGDYYVHHKITGEDFTTDHVMNAEPYSEAHAEAEALLYELQVMVLRDAEDADFPGEPE